MKMFDCIQITIDRNIANSLNLDLARLCVLGYSDHHARRVLARITIIARPRSDTAIVGVDIE